MKKIKQKFNYYITYLLFLINKILLKKSNKINNTPRKKNSLKEKFNHYLTYLVFLINKILLKKSNKINNTPLSKNLLKVSNFNKVVIILITLLFTYLFYLSIPSLYNKTWVQNSIEEKLFDKFNINFSISSQITYEILPFPHFKVKNAKIFDDNNKQLSDIKKLKIFISQKNLFNKGKLKIKNIKIDNANFTIQKSDFKFIKKIINNQFSQNIIQIKNSNLFYKDRNNNTISIVQLNNLVLFYDDLKSLNNIILNGATFNTPFTFRFKKNLINKESITLINSKKLNIEFDNRLINEKESVKGTNKFSLLNLQLNSQYELKDNLLSFKSKKNQLSNDKVKYSGKLNLDPFDLILNIDLQEINLQNLLDRESILFQFIRTNMLFNVNLSSAIFINSSNVTRNKLFDSSKIIINQRNGSIDFDGSQFINNKIGILTIKNSELRYKDDDIFFISDFNLNIKNQQKFFNFFQSSKKIRKKINNIFFNLEFDVRDNKLSINNFKIDDIKSSNKLTNFLNNYNKREKSKLLNLIEFKNLVNQLLLSYDG